jgi:hypothetical protein
MTLLSSRATFRARLCQPIQQQAAFALTPIAVNSQVAPPRAGSRPQDIDTREAA